MSILWFLWKINLTKYEISSIQHQEGANYGKLTNNEFPLARTQYKRFYLNASNESMQEMPVENESKNVYTFIRVHYKYCIYLIWVKYSGEKIDKNFWKNIEKQKH